MKVISIWGPWAQLIALGIKDVENRSWSTDYRGPLAIHCTKGGWTFEEATGLLAGLLAEGLITGEQNEQITARLEADRGKVIAVVELVGCQPADGHTSAWAVPAPGGQVFELTGARLVEPVELRGAQGIRDLDEEVAAQIEPGADQRGGYDLDTAELFGRAPRKQSNKEAKEAKREPAKGAQIKGVALEVIGRSKPEVYRHRPHGDLPIEEAWALRIKDIKTDAVVYDSAKVGALFETEGDAREHGRDWLAAQRRREARIQELCQIRRHLLPDRLDDCDRAKAAIEAQRKRLGKLSKECDDDSLTLREEAREPDADLSYSDGRFAIADTPSISEGTAGRLWWGASEPGDA